MDVLYLMVLFVGLGAALVMLIVCWGEDEHQTKSFGKTMFRLGPVFINVIIFSWTLIVSSTEYYSSAAASPAVVGFIVIAIWHIYLLIKERNKWVFALYGIFHGFTSVHLLIGSVMVATNTFL